MDYGLWYWIENRKQSAAKNVSTVSCPRLVQVQEGGIPGDRKVTRMYRRIEGSLVDRASQSRSEFRSEWHG